MRKSLFAFVVLTILLFGIFAELLAIRKEAIFDEYAKNFVEGFETEIDQWKGNLDAEVKEYTHDEISKEFYYHIVNETIYVRTNLMDPYRAFMSNTHRRIPIIGMIDVYGNNYCAVHFTAFSIIAFAGASGPIVKLEEETKIKFTEYSGLKEAKTSEQLNNFKESEEYKTLMNEYYKKISTIDGKRIEEYYISILELENPIKNPFSAKRMIMDDILKNYKIYAEKKYREYIQDVERDDFIKATVDAYTVYAISRHSNHIKEGELNPQMGTSMVDLPTPSSTLFFDVVFLLFCSITTSFVILKIIYKKISPVLLGAFIGGVMSIAIYANIIFYIWIPLGGVVSAYKSEIRRKREIFSIGIETGILSFILDYVSYSILSLFGLTNAFKLDVTQSIFDTPESAIIYLIGIPLIFIILSICGSIAGFTIKRLNEKRMEKKKEKSEEKIS